MSRWPDFGARLAQRLTELGYEKNGRPDVMRFSFEKRYMPTYLYKWVAGVLPVRENLERLARDLEVRPGWLLFGDDDGPARLPRSRKGRQLAAVLLALGLGWGGLDTSPASADRMACVPAPGVLLGSRGATRDIMSSWWGAWWGLLADAYLDRLWRRGRISFRKWASAPRSLVYGA